MTLPKLAQLPAAIREVWYEETGDRRQELVFLELSLNKEALRMALDRCLSTS